MRDGGGSPAALCYREMRREEAERIGELDAVCRIRNVWRRDPATGAYALTAIDWTDRTLPNGPDWHLDRFRRTLAEGGTAFGCFRGGRLIGYATLNAGVFGINERYMLLEQLYISRESRRQGIGRALIGLCGCRARACGAEKLFVCAGSAEETIAFYHALGFRSAVEWNEALFSEDPNDIQLELELCAPLP